MSPSDAILLDRWIADRDAEAFEVLVNRYAGNVYGACIRILGNTHAAEDVSQESFLKLSDALEDAPTSLGAWLHTVATRRALNRLKSDKRRAVRERDYTDAQPSVSTPAWDDIKKIVDEELTRLPDDQRTALVSHFIEGRTQSDIATEFEVTQQTISNRIKGGLETVRESIAKRGITLTVGVLTTLFGRNLVQAAPSSLLASLGKFAIAGANGASVTTAGVGAKGGMSLMLKFGLGSVLIAAATVIAIVPQTPENVSQSSEPALPTMGGTATETTPTPTAPTQPLVLAQAQDTQDTSVQQKKTHRLARELRDPYAERDLPGWYEPDFTLASLERPIQRIARRLPGRITDSSAAGKLAKLHYVSWHPWEVPTRNSVIAEKRIGSEGQFEFGNLPLGDYILEVRGEKSNAYGLITIHEFYQPPILSAAMFPGRPTGGNVVNESGEFIGGAILHLYTSVAIPRPYWHHFAAIAKITADDKGAWFRSAITGFKHRYYVEAEGYASKITDWMSTGTTDHSVVLDHGGTIKCRIVDAVSKTGMPGAIVYVKGAYHFDYFGGWTDEDGYITLTDIRPGDYELRLEDSRVVFDAPPSRITVALGKTVDVGTIEVVAGGIIQGRVVNSATGNGIAGIELTATTSGRIPKEGIVTDGEGHYEVIGVSGTSYRITRKSNTMFDQHNGLTSVAVSATAGEIVKADDLVLTPGIPLQGRVTDRSGRGVPGAMVLAKMDGEDRSRRTFTDAQGRFSISGFLSPGTINIQASGSGLSIVQQEDIDLPEHGRMDVAITLGKQASVEGNIVEPSGRAKFPIVLFVKRRPDDGQPAFIESPFNYSAVQHGRFQIGNLPEGDYDIFMNRDPRNRNTGVAVGTFSLYEGQRLTGLRLTTETSGISISGTVFSAQGKAIPSAQIRAYPVEAGGGSSSFTQTGPVGTFLLEGLANQPYRVSVDHAEYSAIVEEVQGGTQNKLLTMQARGKISGRVVATGGAPIERFQLYNMLGEQRYQTTFRNSFRGYSSGQGEFLLDRVNMGTNTLFARADGYAVGTFIVHDVRPGETRFNVTIELQEAATLSGIVRDPNGNPVSGAYIENNPQYWMWSSNQSALTKTDSEGRFQTDEIPLGESTVIVRHNDFAPLSVPLYMESGERQEFDLVLRHGGTIEGMVTLDGQPVPNARVIYIQFFSTTDNNMVVSQANTYAQGLYKLDLLRPSAGHVQLSANLNVTAQSIAEPVTVLEGEVLTVDFDMHSDGSP